MDSELIEIAERYGRTRNLNFGARLGAGIHGIVLSAKYHNKPAAIAVKIHADRLPFWREVEGYERLREHGVDDILGFHVPHLLHHDEKFLAIEMTIVSRPFVLDFAAAYLDFPPQFSPEVMADWEEEKREQFGERWETVLRILTELRDMGIHQTDVSPGNIGFA